MTWSQQHRRQFNNKTETKFNPNHGLNAILAHNKNFSHLPPITSSHRSIQTSKNLSATVEIMIKRIIYHDTHIHIRYVCMYVHTRTQTHILSEHLEVWYIAQALWRCPGTSLATSTPNFRLQHGIEATTLCFPLFELPLPSNSLIIIFAVWSHICARVLWSYEGRSNEKGSMLLYCLGLRVLNEHDEGNLVLEVKLNHTHHPTDDPE